MTLKKNRSFLFFRSLTILLFAALAACSEGLQPEHNKDSPQKILNLQIEIGVIETTASGVEPAIGAIVILKDDFHKEVARAQVDESGWASFPITTGYFEINVTYKGITQSRVVQITGAIVETFNFDYSGGTPSPGPQPTPRPNPTPTPTPAPAPPTDNPFARRTWYGSNVGTGDLLDMFQNTAAWATALSKMQVMKFYVQQITTRHFPCENCESNNYDNFKNVGAFSKLRSWNIAVNLDVGSVKDWDCDGSQNINVSNIAMQDVLTAGGQVRFLSMDEPLIAGTVHCGLNSQGVANAVSNYMRAVQARANQLMPGKPFGIGLIEPFPYFKAPALLTFLDQLAANATKPAFFHLDVDWNTFKNGSLTMTQYQQALAALSSKCQELGIPFGVIFEGYDVPTQAAYSANTIDVAQRTRQALPGLQHLVIQSWNANGGVNRIPLNLSESDPTSGTGTFVRSLGLFGL